MAKPAFNTNEVNKYLWSIKDDIPKLVDWVSDLEADFTKAFTDRFDVTPKSKESLDKMDTELKDHVIHGFKEGLENRKNLNVYYYQPMISGIPGGDIPTPKGVKVDCEIRITPDGWSITCTITFEIS